MANNTKVITIYDYPYGDNSVNITLGGVVTINTNNAKFINVSSANKISDNQVKVTTSALPTELTVQYDNTVSELSITYENYHGNVSTTSIKI